MARDDCGETMTPSTPRAQDRVEPAGREAVAAEEELLRAIAVPLRALPDVVERDVLVGAAVQLVVRDVVADHTDRGPHAPAFCAAHDGHQPCDLRIRLIADLLRGGHDAAAGVGRDVGRAAQDARDRHGGNAGGGGHGREGFGAGGGAGHAMSEARREAFFTQCC